MRKLLGLLLLAAGPATAQLRPDLPPAPPSRVEADTAKAVQKASPAEKKAQAAADSAKRTERLFGLRLTRPGKATLLAAILPGAGQVYNRRWWKLPIVYAGLGFVGYREYRYQSLFREYVRGFNARTDGNPDTSDTGPNSKNETSLAAVQTQIVTFRQQRDIYILYCGLAYGIQILDALVDAHLKDFDVSDDLSLRWEPALLPVPGAGLVVAPGLTVTLQGK